MMPDVVHDDDLDGLTHHLLSSEDDGMDVDAFLANLKVY